MVSSIRKLYNEEFRKEKYDAFLRTLDAVYPGDRGFRLAETPVFVPQEFATAMISVCESIVDLIIDPDFIKLTDKSIPPSDKVPGKYGYPGTIVFDFGICKSPRGNFEPQLVEMQGFPSLYAFQAVYPDLFRQFFNIPPNYTQYLGGLDRAGFTSLMKEVILGGHQPENVILLEIEPEKQKTKIDFHCTQDLVGIKPVCLTELQEEGDRLFYLRDGKKTAVHRIYNRIVFDELHSKPELKNAVDITRPWDVEWVPHPDWFYRISKYTLPLIDHPAVPKTFYLNEIKQLPGELSDYVLKPLFSFAGQGVVIDVQPQDIENISDPENWILQQKVHYADAIETPDIPAKAEIRIMYLWKPGAARPAPAINLARLSKGKMIGTRYNQNKEWVGGSVAFFEQ